MLTDTQTNAALGSPTFVPSVSQGDPTGNSGHPSLGNIPNAFPAPSARPRELRRIVAATLSDDGDVLQLAAGVYEGLTEDEIDLVEGTALDRSFWK